VRRACGRACARCCPDRRPWRDELAAVNSSSWRSAGSAGAARAMVGCRPRTWVAGALLTMFAYVSMTTAVIESWAIRRRAGRPATGDRGAPLVSSRARRCCPRSRSPLTLVARVGDDLGAPPAVTAGAGRCRTPVQAFRPAGSPWRRAASSRARLAGGTQYWRSAPAAAVEHDDPGAGRGPAARPASHRDRGPDLADSIAF